MYSLVGIEGNAYNVMAYVPKSMKRERLSQEEIQQYQADAMSKDYDHLLHVSILMIDKLNHKGEN